MGYQVVQALGLCVVLALRSVVTALSPERRVYGGVDDTRSEFPYVVSLMLSTGERSCSGSLIAERWVLTAAHCVKNIGPRFVRYGDFEKIYNDTKTYTAVVRQIPYPIDADGFMNDIGLAHTEKTIKRPLVAISGIDYGTLVGYDVTFAGFGIKTWKLFFKKTFFEDDKISTLKVGDGVVVTCPKVYLSHKHTPAICVSPKCGKKQFAREGDSGGPLVYDGRVLGVAVGLLPEIHLQFWVPVSPYMKWIHDTIS